MPFTPLREQPRTQRAAVLRSDDEFVMLEWLESIGRLKEHEPSQAEFRDEVEEISDLMLAEELIYEHDNEDDELDLDQELQD